jgi:hypothetical protein
MTYKVGDAYNGNRITKMECSRKFGLDVKGDCILHLEHGLGVYLKIDGYYEDNTGITEVIVNDKGGEW